jgi:hypothetical protein
MQLHRSTARRLRRSAPWPALVMILAALTAAPAASAAEWTRYTNARFGASADVPATGFVIQPPPENGDGRRWKSTDGKGEISIYGAFAANADSFAEYRRQELGYARDDGVAITYQSGTSDSWFAYSGTVGGDIVYLKAVRAQPCASLVVNHIYFRYPAEQKARYDAIVAHAAQSLHSEPAAACQ